MAQSFATDAGVLITPGAYARYSVVQQNTGLATTGILMLVGEADAGPDFTEEEDIASNIFGPGQIGDVKAKYKTGRLVDAFNGAAVPANDPQIQGAPSGFILVKTNPSTKAEATLARWDASDYGVIQDRSWGKLGNLISYEVTETTAEVVPTTEAFAFALAIATTNISVRVNGLAAQTLTISALETPATFAAALGGLTGVDTTGGASITLLTVSGTIALTVVAGNDVQIDRSVAFVALPSPGDIVYIPSGSAIQGATNKNIGSYVVTAATASQILATKVLDASGSPGALTAPETVAATSTVAVTDCQSWGAITATLIASIDPLDGYGKNLQIDELTSGTDVLSSLCYRLDEDGEVEAVDWISTAAAPHLIVSGAEYRATLTESRALDGVTNDITVGGEIALLLGYDGTTAVATIDGDTISIATTGGSFSDSPLVASLTDFVTIGDLAEYINSFAGFTCEPGSAVLGSQPSVGLDQGAFGCASTHADLTPGRIKMDAYKLFTTLRDQGFLTELSEQPTSGLPAPTAGVAFLSGGTKGATTDADISAALDALKLARGNFLIPLFSRDAADDIADNLTDTSSTYTIEAVHAAARSHVLQMSTLKKRRNRQAFLSMRAAIDDVKAASGELASFRCSLTFQDVRDRSTATGSVVQFQPWMAACKAAGMQAAGFYRAIFNKGINISGVLDAAGDFNDGDDDAVEQALLAGLLIIARPDTGGFKFVSDQTTYGRDNNFIYNSIQAVYVADIIAMTTAQLMEQAFVGQSLADISASGALSVLDAIMDNFRRLKLIAFSDDAPKGYKNASIRITGPAMVVSAEVKAATALYFIPITFQITQVQQSA